MRASSPYISATVLRANQANWWKSGTPWIWLTAAAVGASILAVLGLFMLLATQGLGHFWPAEVIAFDYQTESGTERIIGEIAGTETISKAQYIEAVATAQQEDVPESVERWLIKTGNRRAAAPDFRWVFVHRMSKPSTPKDILVFERTEWGNAYGFATAVIAGGTRVSGQPNWRDISRRIDRARGLRGELDALETSEINTIDGELESLRLERRRRALARISRQLPVTDTTAFSSGGARGYPSQEDASSAPGRAPRGSLEVLSGAPGGGSVAHDQAKLDDDSDIDAAEERLHIAYRAASVRRAELAAALARDEVAIRLMDDNEIRINLGSVVRAWQPNNMSFAAKLGHYLAGIWAFLSGAPREANTEGGVFPALFGTVMMVLVMSVLVTPFGVVAALYLHEYAGQGLVVRITRIAVNNLAGVPSIVYGVFGLGLFVYVVGGTLDDLFYPEARPAPTFGTPGLLWASLTLALLTVPVVIVATEEGLARIPRVIREGSLALGATKAETIFKTILPMASPSILTGVILAVARAAGEVAPLMLVGVVKLAPALPVDGNFPYIHLERQFMHLGFHIYDVGFLSPNVDASRPLVYATALLLIVMVVVLNLSATLLRNRLEALYRTVGN